MDLSSYKPLSGPTLQAATNDFVGVKLKGYKDPTDTLTKNTQAFIEALADENEELINQYVTKLNLAACRYPGLDNVGIYVPRNKIDFPVMLCWRFGKADNLFLESPHEGRDGVQNASCDLFVKTNARCLLRNALHPASAEGTHAAGQSDRRTSDAAHSYTCLFTDIHKKLFNMYGVDAVYLQVHGMASTKDNLFLTNQKGSQYTTTVRSFPTCLAKQLTESFSLDQCNNFRLGTQSMPGSKDGKPYVMNNFKQGAAWFPTHSPCPNTCIQARITNGGGAHDVGKTDRGVFLHMECGVKMRGGDSLGQNLRDNLCQTINNAMVDWNNSPLPKPQLPFQPTHVTQATTTMAARAVLSDAELNAYETSLKQQYPNDYLPNDTTPVSVDDNLVDKDLNDSDIEDGLEAEVATTDEQTNKNKVKLRM